MANTGYKQATIAYKTSPDGRPLDVDGRLTSVSGKRQAIALLIGRSNPNPTLYEVQFYFNIGQTIQGVPTKTYDILTCPVGYISLSPQSIILDSTNPSASFTLESTAAWYLESYPPGIAEIDYVNGSAGTYLITLNKTNTVGQGAYIFRNLATNETAVLWVSNVLNRPWVLDTGTWNMLGFWYDNETWNF